MTVCLLTCPITHQIFSDPVIISDGHTYECDAIIRWLQTSDISPLTGSQCKDLIPNYLVNSIVDQYMIDHSCDMSVNPASCMQ
jgi:SUMO ligase MMS21 Smc5/6 complex component